MRDSLINKLTKEQKEFFKDSKVRDNDNNLLICYHGSDSLFSTFSHDFIADDNKDGYGFYFTLGKELQFEHEAKYACYLNITRPLYDTDDNFEDVLVRELELRKTMSAKKVLETISKEFDIDGVIDYSRNNAVCFFANQIKKTNNLKPTDSDNMSESYNELDRDCVVQVKSYKSDNKHQVRSYWKKVYTKRNELACKMYDALLKNNFDVEVTPLDYQNPNNSFHVSMKASKNNNFELYVRVYEDNKLLQFLEIYNEESQRGNHKPDLAIKTILDCIDSSWTVEPHVNLNNSFWRHIRDKYSNYHWINISESVEEKLNMNKYLYDDPVHGPSFITEEGKFLRCPGDTHTTAYSFLDDEEDYNSVEDFCNKYHYIRVNDGSVVSFEVYMNLTKEKPTDAQFKAIEKYLDYVLNKDIEGVSIDIMDTDEFQHYSIYDADTNTDEIMNKIRNYYTSGKLRESLLIEKNRQELINKSRSGREYSKKNQLKGKNRWERRRYSQIANSVRDYNQIDMNSFFKGDILEFKIKVKGETDDYLVTITFEHILKNIQQEIKSNNNKLEFKCILRALLRSFNGEDVYINCTCLHPDTRIKLLDGTNPTVAEMKERFDKGEKLYVFSTDDKGDFKPGEVNKVWITKTTKDFIKVTLDNGQEILTTPEHLYMLRDGSYDKAENLKEGQSLMPMYFNESKGYPTVKLNSAVRGWKSIYKLVADYFKKDEITEAEKRADSDELKMSYKVAIHHKDFNKYNNTPDNLQIMTAEEHWKYHASLCGENRPVTEKMREVSRANAIKRNSNPTEAMIASRKAWQEKGLAHNYDPEWQKIQAEIMRTNVKKYRESMTEEDKIEESERLSELSKNAWKRGCFNTEAFKNASIKRGKEMHTAEREKLATEGIRKYWSNLSEEDRQKRAEITKNNARIGALSKISKILQIIISNNEDLTIENYEKHRKELNGGGYPKIKTHFKDINEAVKYFNLNHKIVKVERVTLEDTPVYDIEVKDWHNFVVDAGVVLHNCKDFAYRFAHNATKGRYNSGRPELRPNLYDWTNKNDDMGAGCKHINLVLSNTDWMMKIASVINNYIKWCKENMQRNYADIIFPAVYGMRYDKAVQLSIFDDEENNGYLPSDQKYISQVIDTGFRGKDDKGKWAKGNEFRFSKKNVEKAPEDDERQMHLDLGLDTMKKKQIRPEEKETTDEQ